MHGQERVENQRNGEFNEDGVVMIRSVNKNNNRTQGCRKNTKWDSVRSSFRSTPAFNVTKINVWNELERLEEQNLIR